MSLLGQALNVGQPPPVPQAAMPIRMYPEILGRAGTHTGSGQLVNPETAKRVATAYRCGNVISDDIASMPMQVFHRVQSTIDRIYPDPVARNHAYLLGRQPNRWQNPFIFKKTVINWLLFWGNAYIWAPPSSYPELFILQSNVTYPEMDADGNLWYRTAFPNSQEERLPEAEVVHLMINSPDGFNGRSILTYARETLGRQMSAHETLDRISGGLTPGAALWINGEVDRPAREAVKKAYLDAVTGSQNAGAPVIFDNKITKFEKISINPVDAQFLEGTEFTDTEIANYFGVPLYKINRGKQSYESNAQNDLEYLKSTLNPYLVQWEEAANLHWVTEADQPFVYIKFNRDALLQTDAQTRADVISKRIQSGQLSPNEGRAIEDQSSYQGGDSHYMMGGVAKIQDDGSLQLANGTPAPASK